MEQRKAYTPYYETFTVNDQQYQHKIKRNATYTESLKNYKQKNQC